MFKNFKMPGDGGLGYRERLGKLHHRRLAEGETGKQCAPGWIGKGGESGVKVVHVMYSLYNLVII